jgi:anti-sigma factor RsiW
MNCSRFQQDLSALLDGELDGPRKEALKGHLLECPECSLALSQMRTVTDQVRYLSRQTMAGELLADKVKQRIDERTARRTMAQGLRVWGRVPLFAALVLIALGMGNFAGRSVSQVLFPTTHESLNETMLLENGESFGDIFLELTQSNHSERFER